MARLLEVEYRLLVWVVYANRESYYEQFTIPKRSGGTRDIRAPKGSLKLLQHKLADVLSEVYQTKPPVHGFAKTKSIVSNAGAHRRSNYVLNLDLEDFFPTIHFGRVRGMFEGKPYNRPHEVATMLAATCCSQDRLPQGAPTSPIVSNMLCGQLDSELLRLAASVDSTYTRYADDLTFSTRRRTFPDALASIDPVDAKHVVLGKPLTALVARNGFTINAQKTRLQHRNRRQVVTGLIVNQRPNVARRTVRQIRSMLHAWERFGLKGAQDEFTAKWDKRPGNRRRPDTSFVDVLQGRIAFVAQVRGTDDPLSQTLRRRFGAVKQRDLHPAQPNRSRAYVRANGVFGAEEPVWEVR